MLQQEIASAAGLMNFLRTMAGAIGASIAVTVWDDHAKVARSEMVSKTYIPMKYKTHFCKMVLRLTRRLELFQI